MICMPSGLAALGHTYQVNPWSPCYNHSMSIVPLQLLYLGVMIASAVTLSTIDDVSSDHIPAYANVGKDREKYRGVAGWILFVSIAGIITQVIMLIIHLLYHLQCLKHQFLTFAIIVSSDTTHRGSGIANGRPGSAQTHPNVCCALPLKIDIL